jgi:hypothetical protein
MGPKVMLIALVVFFGGVVSIAFGYAAHRRDLALRRWPTAIGRIVSCKIIQTTDARLRAPAHSAAPRPEPDYKFIDVWAMDVEYRYTVDGVERTGYRATSSRLVENMRKDNPEPGVQLKTLQAQFPAESPVRVHYDPANPTESYLAYIDSPGKRSLFKTGVGLAVVGLAIGIAGKVLFRQY